MTTLLGSGAPAIEVGAVGAERLFGQERAGRGIRPRAAAAANRVVAAIVALAFERLRIAELLEDRRVVPDVLERLHARVAGGDRQVPAGIDAAFVRDEADARAGEAAARHRGQVLVSRLRF